MEAATLTNDPKLDEMFNRASGSLDPVEVGKILVEAYLYQYNQYHYIPICHTNDELATTKRIPGWDLGKRRKDMNLNDLIRQR